MGFTATNNHIVNLFLRKRLSKLYKNLSYNTNAQFLVNRVLAGIKIDLAEKRPNLISCAKEARSRLEVARGMNLPRRAILRYASVLEFSFIDFVKLPVNN